MICAFCASPPVQALRIRGGAPLAGLMLNLLYRLAIHSSLLRPRLYARVYRNGSQSEECGAQAPAALVTPLLLLLRNHARRLLSLRPRRHGPPLAPHPHGSRLGSPAAASPSTHRPRPRRWVRTRHHHLRICPLRCICRWRRTPLRRICGTRRRAGRGAEAGRPGQGLVPARRRSRLAVSGRLIRRRVLPPGAWRFSPALHSSHD